MTTQKPEAERLNYQNAQLRRALRHLLDQHAVAEHWAWQEARELLANDDWVKAWPRE